VVVRREGRESNVQEGTAVRRAEEDADPDTNLASVLVEEEHVLDEGETDDLTGGEENGGERAEDVVSLERLAEDGTEDEESADELGPVIAGKSVLRKGE
jgi:hypothetical protein